jgi:hypothetical protein
LWDLATKMVGLRTWSGNVVESSIEQAGDDSLVGRCVKHF